MLVQGSAPAYQPAAVGVRESSRSGAIVMNAVPRGFSSHLYPPHTVTAQRLASTGSHPAACVTSSSTRVPVASQACASASRSARRPSADCTALTDTHSVDGRTASASASSGTSRTSRSVRARKGNVIDVKSPAATSTSAPAGSADATSPTIGDTTEPTATDDDATPTSSA